MSIRRLSTTALGLAALVACADDGTGPATPERHFPLEVGNRWTYAPEDPDPLYGPPFTWEVTARRGDTVELARPPGQSHPGPVTLLDGVEDVHLLVDGAAPLPFYHFTPGTSWVHRDPWDCDDGATLLAVRETEPIVTPAGTFRGCLRIERRTTASCDDAGTMFEWWAPGVGLVRWDELNFYAGAPISFLLVEYDVD